MLAREHRNNPFYIPSTVLQWDGTKVTESKEGWYFADEHDNWHGVYKTERDALRQLLVYIHHKQATPTQKMWLWVTRWWNDTRGPRQSQDKESVRHTT